MAVVYFDASALVKLAVEGAGTELAVELCDGCDVALASRLAYAEVCAALAAAGRNDDLSTADLGVAESMWDEFWDAVRPVELTVRFRHLRAGSCPMNCPCGKPVLRTVSSWCWQLVPSPHVRARGIRECQTIRP